MNSPTQDRLDKAGKPLSRREHPESKAGTHSDVRHIERLKSGLQAEYTTSVTLWRSGRIRGTTLVPKSPNELLTGAFPMGLFGGKDWNVIAIIYERREMYRVNGQRGKGGNAVKCRDGAKNHERTIYWAVFNQKRAFVEGGGGNGEKMVTNEIIAQLKKEFSINPTVTSILGMLERGEQPMASKPLAFSGYPKPEHGPEN